MKRIRQGTISRVMRRSLLGTAVLWLGTVSLFSQSLVLPPRASSPVTLADAMDRRMSVRSFGEKAVDLDKVSWLLWAIGRCSPPGIQAGDVYVKIGSSSYILGPDKTSLLKVDSLPPMRMGGPRPAGRPGEAPPSRPGENPPPGGRPGEGTAQARPGTPPGPPRMDAPLMLVLTTAAKTGGDASDPILWLWRGFAGQAMYLGAPALGLGIVTIGGLGFRAGVPAQAAEFIPNPGPEGRPFPPLGKASVMTLEDAIAKDNTALAPKAEVGKEAVDALFWAAYGYSHVQENGRAHRTVPSARNRYPMGVQGLSGQGLVRYKPDQNSTEPVRTGDLRSALAKACNVGWISLSPYIYLFDWDRSILSSRDMALYEAGSMLANMIWMANAWDVGLRWTLISDTTAVRIVLGPDPVASRIPLLAVGFLGTPSNIPAPKGISVKTDAAVGYKDGQYEGQCLEWPEMKVRVTVKNQHIDQVAVLLDNGTPDFSKPVVETLPKAMAGQGKVDVDGISGSTLSSNNLKKAVRDALSKAN